MSTPRIWLVALALAALTVTAAAGPPSDAQVKKDMTSPGALAVRLSSGGGRVEANTDTLVYEYIRRVEIVRTTEYPGVKVIVTGDAVYQRVGGSYRYWKFRVLENHYEGLSNPTADEIDAVLATDRAAEFGVGMANVIVKIVEPPHLTDKPAWNWPDPRSVTVSMIGKVDIVANNTELETKALTVEIRLYRDDLKGPWKRFMATPGTSVSLGKTKYTSDEIGRMPRLVQQAREAGAAAAHAKLPAVTLPSFATPQDLARYLHGVLREGPRDRAEAVLRALIAPRHYVTGSTVQLSSDAERMIMRSLDAAFGPATYAQQYCANATIDMRNSKAAVSIVGVKDTIVTSLRVELAGGKLVDGVAVGAKLVIDDVAVRTRDDTATRDWIASFSDRKKLCPND